MANGVYRRRKRVNIWLILLICLVSIELGGMLGVYLSRWPQFTWAATALEIGTENPWVFSTPLHDGNILLKTRFNAGSLFGLCLGIGLYGLLHRR